MRRAAAQFLWLMATISVSSAVLAGPVTEERARQLENLVRQDCGSCHGMTLKGGLGPDIRPKRFIGVAPEAIARIILDGVPGTPMPPWRPLLSEQDARWIALYLSGDTNQ